MSKPITSLKEAHDKLDQQIEEVEKEITMGSQKLGDVTEAEMAEVESHTTDAELLARTARQWEISHIQSDQFLLQRLKETKEQELIFPHGKYVMVPKGTQLLSPSGFRCEEKVFIKPESGCLVDVLPRSSNMGYYDFT